MDLLTATQNFMWQADQLDYVGDFNASERDAWLREEYKEYLKALADGNEAEMVDGLLDIIVIAWGTILQRYGPGWAEILANEVARSNLEKIEGGVIRREDGKIQKPEGWEPPRIKEILEEFHRLQNPRHLLD